MTVAEAMRTLQELGNEATRKIYIKHGAGENQFGVKFSDLGKLAKKVKTDTALARGLWETGNIDARLLATMIANSAELSEEEIDAWVRTISYYALADALMRNVAIKRPDATALMTRWMDDPAEYVAQSGWDLLGLLAAADTTLPDSYFSPYLDRIEREIHSSANRVRYAMNGAVIAIGVRNEALRRAATAAAKRIGKVHVDHGQTGCKTPDACEYIQKTLDYRAKKAKA